MSTLLRDYANESSARQASISEAAWSSFFGVDRSQPARRLEGFFSYPRCRVPHAGRCPESLLDAWDLYDTGPPDTACLCEGGACVSSPTTASRPPAAPGR